MARYRCYYDDCCYCCDYNCLLLLLLVVVVVVVELSIMIMFMCMCMFMFINCIRPGHAEVCPEVTARRDMINIRLVSSSAPTWSPRYCFTA